MEIPDTLDQLALTLRSGELDLETYLETVSARIDEREPRVFALEQEPGRFERLRREAAELQAAYPDPAARPDLYGVAVGVKDIFRVDGLSTRAGSKLPPEEFAGDESGAVRRLRSAGALILGKTVSTEFAYFAPGATRNPHDEGRTPGGSSSGSAAAVGAGECPLALGTQTIGSISRPASFCGVVGFKPSYDRVPRDGVIPLAPSLDHVGTFTTTVGGARLVAPILCDEWHPCRARHRPVLGVWTGHYLDSAEPEGRKLFAEACERLAACGYRIRSVEARAGFPAIRDRHDALLAAEAARVHETWAQRYGDRYHPKTMELIERGRRLSPAVVSLARAGRLELRRELMVLKAEHRIDLWISPASRGVAPRGLDSTGDPVMNLPWTHAGLPTVTIPGMTNADGMPFGLQIAAGWYEDERLLKWAEGLESALADRERS